MGASATGNSYLSEFKRCRRKFYYHHVIGLEKQTRSLALDIGTLTHEGLAVLPFEGIEKAEEKMLEVWGGDAGEGNMSEYWAGNEYGEQTTALDLALLLVEGYDVEYVKSAFTPMIPEFEFEFELPSGHIYTGKIDSIVRGPGDRFYIMEHKTTGVNPSTYLKEFFLNPQITGYYVGARGALPPEGKISGIIVDLLIKPRRGKKGFSPITSKNYVQEIFIRSAEQVQSFLTNTSRIFTEIDRCEGKKEAFYQCEHECYSFYTVCPYLDLCTYGDDDLSAFTLLKSVDSL